MVAASHAARCDATALQPGSCLPFGALRADALDAWASRHGVKSVQFGTRGVESCEEVLVGLPDERALACMVTDVEPFEAPGLDGPTQVLYSLVIAEPSRGRLVTLVALDVPPADCAAAPESTRAYWKRQPSVPARVQQLASAADAKRIASLCQERWRAPAGAHAPRLAPGRCVGSRSSRAAFSTLGHRHHARLDHRGLGLRFGLLDLFSRAAA